MTAESTRFIHVIYIATTPQKVFETITRPEIARAYWGHENVSDWKPGSRWQHVRANDERKVELVGEVVENTPPSRLVMTDDCSCMPPEWLEKYAAEEIARGETLLNTSVTTFEDLGDGRTRMRMEITCTSNRLRDGLVEAGMNDGWGESFEKLDAVLETP